MTPQMVEENLKGTLHHAAVFFTETSFQEEKKGSLNGRRYTVRLNKEENNPDFVELVKFLKTFKP